MGFHLVATQGPSGRIGSIPIPSTISLNEKDNGYEIYNNKELIFDSIEQSLESINDIIALLENIGFEVE